jgi:hypothetical protein
MVRPVIHYIMNYRGEYHWNSALWSENTSKPWQWQFSFLFNSWNSWSVNFSYCPHRKHVDASWHAVSCVQKYCCVQIACLWKTCSLFYPTSPSRTHPCIPESLANDCNITFCLWHNSLSKIWRSRLGWYSWWCELSEMSQPTPGYIQSYICLTSTDKLEEPAYSKTSATLEGQIWSGIYY